MYQSKEEPKNGTEALGYLKERARQDSALKQEELELKKQENKRFQNIQTQQIHMFKVMMDQQEQVQKQEKDDMSKISKPCWTSNSANRSKFRICRNCC